MPNTTTHIWNRGVPLKDMERDLIEDALVYYLGNKRATARALGISLKTLYNKLGKYKRADAKAGFSRSTVEY